jgi:hypothetical protein
MEATFRLNAVPVAALPGDEPVGLRRAHGRRGGGLVGRDFAMGRRVPHTTRTAAGAHEPAEEFARTVRGVGRKSVGFQSKGLFGTLDHHFGRGPMLRGVKKLGFKFTLTM